MYASNNKAEQFLIDIQQTGFLKRLFSWGTITRDAREAYTELSQRTIAYANVMGAADKDRQAIERLNAEKKELEGKISSLSSEITQESLNLARMQTSVSAKDESISDLNDRMEKKEIEFKQLLAQRNELEVKLAELNALELKRQSDYQEKIANLNKLYEELTGERKNIQTGKENEIRERFERMKETWRVHEKNVQQAMVQQCKVHGIEFVDKKGYSLKGSPDNVILINGKYVIFDAKSPQGENLDNFSTYIDSQVKSVSKYLEDGQVMRYVFLVVPSNAIETVATKAFHGADYSVFVITIDSLEPILLNLKRIEDYEFTEAMSPEEMEGISHTVARLTHLTKRRIEIDAGMAREAMATLSRCKELPEEMQDVIAKSEKAAILNPKMERTGKAITDKQLKESVSDLEKAESEVIKKDRLLLEKETDHKQ